MGTVYYIEVVRTSPGFVRGITFGPKSAMLMVYTAAVSQGLHGQLRHNGPNGRLLMVW